METKPKEWNTYVMNDFLIINEKGIEVCRVTNESKADAKLIASAPDLLAALIKLYNAIDSCIDLTPELLKDCENAIKKATK